MKRRSALALIALAAGGGILFFPQQAHAIPFLDIVTNLVSLSFEGLDFVQNVLFGVLTRIFVALLVSSVALFSSARFLDWAVGIPIDLQNSLVTAGFKFTSGLVNLVIVVLFVLVAFSAILKFDAFGAKKALPKLIVVALLVNFSMLIVGFFVDIAQVFFNSIQTAALGKDLADSAIGTLGRGIKEILDGIGIFFGVWLAAYLLPPFLPVTVAFLGTKIISSLNGGDLLQAIFLIAINTILAGMFGLYALLFVARVVIIWLLAIVAPLALAAWAFPVKNNYFGDWFKQLVSWSFLGIVAFFLMAIGLKLFSEILVIKTPDIAGSSTLPFFSGFYAYIFLAVYLFIAFQVSKKFAPAAATALIEQGKALVAPQLKAMGSRLGSAAWTRFGKKPAEEAGKWVRTRGEGWTRWGEQKKGLLGAMARSSGWGAKRMGKRIEAGAGTLSRGVATQAQQEATAAENEQYIYAADARDKINDELRKGAGANWNRVIGLVNSMIKHGDSDDLQEYIHNGLLDGKAVGKALLFGQERLGPAGYRPMIKALGGMIYTDPEKLGWRVQQAAEITPEQESRGYKVKDGVVIDSYGSKAIKGKDKDQTNFLENTVKREIVEKLRPEEVTQLEILGDYMKKANEPEFAAGADALMTRFMRERGGDLLGVTARKGGTREARQYIGDIINRELNTHFGTDPEQTKTIDEIPRELLNSFASAIKFKDSPGAATLGIPIEYQAREERRTTVESAIRDALLRRRDTEIPLEEQIAQDLTTRRTELQERVTQLNARTRELGNLIREAEAGGVYDLRQADIPRWREELANIPAQINEVGRHLQEVATGLRQIEGLRIPEPPAPLPRIQPGMPSPLRAAIERGSQVTQAVDELTKDMQKSLGGIRDTQTDFNQVLQTMENLQNQIEELNEQEQAGALAPTLQAQRDELQNELQKLAQTRLELGQEIQRQTETAIRTKETIEERKIDLEGVRQQIDPLREEYEARQARVQAEKRIRQRRKRS